MGGAGPCTRRRSPRPPAAGTGSVSALTSVPVEKGGGEGAGWAGQVRVPGGTVHAHQQQAPVQWRHDHLENNDLIFIKTHDAVRLAWLETDCNTLG